MPLHILRTEYASVARPIVAFIDDRRQRHQGQIIVLIPAIVPDRLRYRLLHNHLDTVLSAAQRGREDIVMARVALRVQSAGRRPIASPPSAAVPPHAERRRKKPGGAS